MEKKSRSELSFKLSGFHLPNFLHIEAIGDNTVGVSETNLIEVHIKLVYLITWGIEEK
jgi:hypothetical protein